MLYFFVKIYGEKRVTSLVTGVTAVLIRFYKYVILINVTLIVFA